MTTLLNALINLFVTYSSTTCSGEFFEICELNDAMIDVLADCYTTLCFIEDSNNTLLKLVEMLEDNYDIDALRELKHTLDVLYTEYEDDGAISYFVPID